jgi:hypothetical protein
MKCDYLFAVLLLSTVKPRELVSHFRELYLRQVSYQRLDCASVTVGKSAREGISGSNNGKPFFNAETYVHYCSYN